MRSGNVTSKENKRNRMRKPAAVRAIVIDFVVVVFPTNKIVPSSFLLFLEVLLLRA